MADLTGPNPDEVNGVEARGVAITAKPVIVGGRGSTATPATVTDGQSVDLWADVRGVLNVSLRDTAGAALVTVAAALGDSIANPTIGGLAAFGLGFNGTTWERLGTLGLTGATPNVDTGILAVGVGPGWDRERNPANLGTVIGNTSATDVDGAGIITVAITTTTTGTFTIEATADDSNWIAVDATDVAANTWISGTNLTPTAAKVYKVRSGGYRQIRLRTVATLGATMAHKFTGHAGHVMPVAVGTEIQALADAATNFTTAIVGTALLGFNGTTWDRIRTANTGRLQVDVITGGGGGTQYVGDAAATATPTGTMSMGLAHAAPPTAVSADNDAVALWTDRAGRLTVKETAATATLGVVAPSATSVTLLTANSSRLGFAIHNDSGNTLYVKYGATASTSSYTYKIWPGGTLIEPEYTGIVDGIWTAAGSGTGAHTTELT